MSLIIIVCENSIHSLAYVCSGINKGLYTGMEDVGVVATADAVVGFVNC